MEQPDLPHLYLIPGLGAGPEVFRGIDWEPYPFTCLTWIPPTPKETLGSYAGRLLEQVTDRQNPVLIGVSFGGMLALEMAQLLSPRLTISLSSIVSRSELPGYLRLLAQLKLDQLIPAAWFTQAHPLAYYLFGVKQAPDRKLLKAMLGNTDPTFLKWAIRSVATWEAATVSAPLVRIHGTADRVLPAPSAPDMILIKKGGHLMIRTHARELSDQIRQAVDHFAGPGRDL